MDSPHGEHVVDRPDVEALRGVELTGTNGRVRHSILRYDPGGHAGQHGAQSFTAIDVTDITSRPLAGSRTATTTPSWRGCSDSCGGHGPGETPGIIPNPEAKTWHGDGTAFERMWESSTPPQQHLTRGVPNKGTPLFCISRPIAIPSSQPKPNDHRRLTRHPIDHPSHRLCIHRSFICDNDALPHTSFRRSMPSISAGYYSDVWLSAYGGRSSA